VFAIHHLAVRIKKHRVDCSGRHLTPAGNRGKVETPQGKARGGSTSSPGNLVPGAERNGPFFHTNTHLKQKFTFFGKLCKYSMFT
jgi:hypothetical protein